MILKLSGGTVVPGRVQTINQLLREMDVFCRNNGVPLAATNRPDVLDSDGARSPQQVRWCSAQQVMVLAACNAREV
jgi:ATP-dependent Zn protease